MLAEGIGGTAAVESTAGVTAGALAQVVHGSPRSVAGSLRGLRRQGLIATDGAGRWALTARGAERAGRDLWRERLWKGYLAHQMDLPVDAVHLGIDEIERLLPPELIRQLDADGDGQGVTRPAADAMRPGEPALTGGQPAGTGGDL